MCLGLRIGFGYPTGPYPSRFLDRASVLKNEKHTRLWEIVPLGGNNIAAGRVDHCLHCAVSAT